MAKTPRAANTYRAARRNACFEQRLVWGPQFYYKRHAGKVVSKPAEGRQWLPFAVRQQLRDLRPKKGNVIAAFQQFAASIGAGIGMIRRHQARGS